VEKFLFQDNWFESSVKKNIKWEKEMLENYFSRFQSNKIRKNEEGDSPYGHGSVTLLLDSFIKHTI